ncbi:MAG: dNTP triphosphohydrolase [Phycisphaerae bacterium]|nr:dNTP triphosphohydrolase [Phycisphaerae bacterium]
MSDHRTEFQRDYDRVVFSAPVRRLQDKAQVFPLEPNDAVRTRLTHSLEVSTLARGIVDCVAGKGTCNKAFRKSQAKIEVVAATAGLVHDLGNPPFGHFGEAAIKEWFASGNGKAALDELRNHPQLAGDFSEFEGNARTLRLLCNLQILADRHGLNLTAATLSAAMKYTSPSHKAASSQQKHEASKPGFLFSEDEIVGRIRWKTDTHDRRNPIAFIVEAADDCVYALCDLEDAVKKGIMTWEALCSALREKGRRDGGAKNAVDGVIEKTESEIKKRLEQSGLRLSGRARDDTFAQMFRVYGASCIVEGAAQSFLANYEAIMDGAFGKELLAADEAGGGRLLVKVCKKVGREHVYSTRQNIELELRGRKVIQDLLDLLWLGVKDFNGGPPRARTLAGKAWNLLSESYRCVFVHDWNCAPRLSQKTGIPEAALHQYYRLLLITDYIGGMTDTFACTLHRSLSNGH